MDVLSITVRIKDVVMEARYLKGKDILPTKLTLQLCLQTSTFSSTRFSSRVMAPSSRFPRKTMSELFKNDAVLWLPVQALYQSSEEDHLVRVKVSNSLYKSLVQIMTCKGKTLSLESLEKEADPMIPLKHKIGTLHDGLFFLIQSGFNQPTENSWDEKPILIDIEAVANRVISVCNTYLAAHLTDENVNKMDSELLKIVKIPSAFDAKAKRVVPSKSNIPFPQGSKVDLHSTPFTTFRRSV
ncbi:OLC1v1018723C1 [Oldenlandia corymbosa var. corymbosa]|uniref:OLC1v1018723C1 n=1 Tax=Oldenlandia corymbosa var. corymbosa TaxID=529605 RepID=A0AAV1ECN4_OLDCO|nr:OLC1v1018723C1 [Oldenlandia corymbosa var. corymbosa]